MALAGFPVRETNSIESRLSCPRRLESAPSNRVATIVTLAPRESRRARARARGPFFHARGPGLCSILSITGYRDFSEGRERGIGYTLRFLTKVRIEKTERESGGGRGHRAVKIFAHLEIRLRCLYPSPRQSRLSVFRNTKYGMLHLSHDRAYQ